MSNVRTTAILERARNAFAGIKSALGDAGASVDNVAVENYPSIIANIGGSVWSDGDIKIVFDIIDQDVTIAVNKDKLDSLVSAANAGVNTTKGYYLSKKFRLGSGANEGIVYLAQNPSAFSMVNTLQIDNVDYYIFTSMSKEGNIDTTYFDNTLVYDGLCNPELLANVQLNLTASNYNNILSVLGNYELNNAAVFKNSIRIDDLIGTIDVADDGDKLTLTADLCEAGEAFVSEEKITLKMGYFYYMSGAWYASNSEIDLEFASDGEGHYVAEYDYKTAMYSGCVPRWLYYNNSGTQLYLGKLASV